MNVKHHRRQPTKQFNFEQCLTTRNRAQSQNLGRVQTKPSQYPLHGMTLMPQKSGWTNGSAGKYKMKMYIAQEIISGTCTPQSSPI